MKRNRFACFLVGSVLALCAIEARADFAAAECTADRGSHLDILSSKYSSACFGHVERDAVGRYVRVVALPEPMSGSVRATKDLRSVVYIATYMPLLADEALAQDPIVVRVYRDGALKAEHRLSAIASKIDLQDSISHVSFTKDVIGSVGSDNKLAFTTRSGTKRTINVETGTLE